MLLKLKNLRISVKINLVVVITVFLIISISGYVNNEMEKSDAVEAAIESANNTAVVIRDSLEEDMMNWNPERIQNTVKIIAKNQKNIKKVIIVDQHDAILASTNEKELGEVINKTQGVCSKCHGLLSKKSLENKTLDGEPMTIRASKENLTIAAPVLNKESCSSADCHYHSADDKVLGMIQVDFSLKSIYAEIFKRRTEIIIVNLIAITVISLVIYLCLKVLITIPTRRLLKDIKQVAGGDLTHQAKVSSEDEIGQLAQGFNPMVKKLHASVKKDRKHKEYLEKEIARVQQVIEAAASGDLSVKFEVIRSDEFGRIGESLNKMTDELDRMIREEKERHEYLERQVDRLQEVMEATSHGDLSKRYVPEKEDQIGRLGISLNNTISDLDEMFKSQKESHEYLQRQVGHLSKHIRTIASGDFNAVYYSEKNDEFGKIGNELNRMVKNIKAMIEQIESLKFADKRKKEILEEQIREIQEIIAHAARGDFTKALSSNSTDHIIGELKNNLNMMFRSLCVMIRKIGDSSSLVEESSQTLATIASQLEKGAQEQASSIEEAYDGVGRMKDSISEIARSSENVMVISSGASNQARTGGETISKALDSMNGVTETMGDIQGVMSELETSAEDIEEIVKVINEFSDQTNLLALNASIEAARAGDYGRGFSVVAKEVGVLAASTAESTREIAAMVKKIRDGVKKAISTTNNGMQVVIDSRDMALESRSVLSEIIQAVDQVSTHVQNTVATLEGQRTMSVRITEDMHRVSDISKESAHIAREAAFSVQTLTTLALELDAIVQQFKITQDDPKDRRTIELLALS